MALIVLNDQGGAQMEVTEDQTNTLRAQEHGHQPIVFIEMDKQKEPISFDYSAYHQGQNAKFDFSVRDDGTADTIRAVGPGGVSYVNTICDAPTQQETDS